MNLDEVVSTINSIYKGYYDITIDGENINISRYWIFDVIKHNNYMILTDDMTKVGQQYYVKLKEDYFKDIYKSVKNYLNSEVKKDFTLQDAGIIEGSLQKVKILLITDMEYECEFIDDDSSIDMKIILPKSEIRGEEFNEGDEIDVIVKSIRKYPNSYKVTVSRKSNLLVKELIMKGFADESTKDMSDLEIKEVIRLPGCSSRALVTGNISNYLNIIKNVKEIINEPVYLVNYSPYTPTQILNCFVEFIKEIEWIDFGIQKLDDNNNRQNFCYIYVKKALIPKIIGVKYDKVGSARLYEIMKLTGFRIILKNTEEDMNQYPNYYETFDDVFTNGQNETTIWNCGFRNYFYAILESNGIENLDKWVTSEGSFNWRSLFDNLTGFISENDVNYYVDLFTKEFTLEH